MEQDRTGHSTGPGKPEREEREERDGLFRAEPGEEERTRPTWRGLLIAVIAAVVLSVGATLLLGGTFGFTRQEAATGCGAGAVHDCCPPREGR